MTHDESFGEAVSNILSAGSDVATDKMRQKLEEEERKEKIRKEIQKNK